MEAYKVTCPIKNESDYYNYKLFSSIILFALIDYNVIYANIGCVVIVFLRTVSYTL